MLPIDLEPGVKRLGSETPIFLLSGSEEVSRMGRPSWDLRYLEEVERRLRELEARVADLEKKASKPKERRAKRKS